MHSMLLALALFQLKKLNIRNQVANRQPCFTSPVCEQKSSPVKLSSFYLFGKTFHSPPLKSLSCCETGGRVLESWYYVEKYQRRRVACYCYQKLSQTNFFKKNLSKCSQIGCFKARNSTRKTLTLRQSPSNDMLQDKSFTGKTMGNLAHQSPRGNMHILLGCIRTSLERFLACLTFHRKEIRLRHLRKRSDPGSAPDYNTHIAQYLTK